MPRIAAVDGLSLAQLEQMISRRKSELQKLRKQRTKLAKELATVDARLARLGGDLRLGRGPALGGRVRNELSLVDTLVTVLGKAGGAMSVGDVIKGVEATGYRSNSANFRGLVNQTLIKERKRFTNTARGMYALKK